MSIVQPRFATISISSHFCPTKCPCRYIVYFARSICYLLIHLVTFSSILVVYLTQRSYFLIIIWIMFIQWKTATAFSTKYHLMKSFRSGQNRFSKNGQIITAKRLVEKWTKVGAITAVQVPMSRTLTADDTVLRTLDAVLKVVLFLGILFYGMWHVYICYLLNWRSV